MFFADPVAAFTNIGRAVRPGGRLVLLAWQGQDRNEWSSAVRQALAGDTPVPGLDENAGLPFSLADPARTEGILTAAGFAGVGFTDVHEPVCYGPDGATAYDFTLGLHNPRDLLASLDAASADAARKRLRATLAAHDTGHGVFFDARAWIITARRR
jgi:SAM-dependent methyltransferase